MTTAYSHSELQDIEVALAELMVPAGTGATGVGVVSTFLERKGVALGDQAATIRHLGAVWQETGSVPPLLEKLVNKALSASDDKHCKSLTDHYFGLHKKLTEKLDMTFHGASQIIGYASIIGSLGADHAMSSAQIAGLLRARGVAAEIAAWAAVQRVLTTLSLAPKLDPIDLKAQFQADLREEERRFADADCSSSLELAERLGLEMGMRPDMRVLLGAISPERGSTHWPYVFMLHFSCTPLDWYDHAPVFLYEFNPRGEAARYLLDKYAGFDTGADPFLNNAKSVDRIDQNWADSKVRMQLRRPAGALVSLLEATGALPFQAKRATGALIRQWCLRQLRLHREPARLLAPLMTEAGISDRILSFVADAETNTRGILEQRLVDTLSKAMHSDPRWKARGLGDSVNAANTPRRKLGDCEYQDSATYTVEAYEAHSGTLTERYVENHRASLNSLIRKRLDVEWLAYSDPDDWQVTVTFVAHATKLAGPIQQDIEGVSVRFEFITFTDLLPEAGVNDAVLQRSFRELFLEVLDRPRVPQQVRDKVLDQLDGT